MKTSGAITGFLLVLWLYPEVSRRAFEEIQSITHGLRLPKVADRSSLPYTEAVFKESIRMRSFMPLGQSPLSDTNKLLLLIVSCFWYHRYTTCQYSRRSP
jgi:cytochrome P450